MKHVSKGDSLAVGGVHGASSGKANAHGVQPSNPSTAQKQPFLEEARQQL